MSAKKFEVQRDILAINGVQKPRDMNGMLTAASAVADRAATRPMMR